MHRSPGALVHVPVGDTPLVDRLYRNEGVHSSPAEDRHAERPLRFTDVTEASGLDARGYGMGVATGDYDNDGWTDLYLANFGANELWRNNGDGTFSDTTTESRAGDGRWSTSAAFLDFDRDGWLDLFVVNYTDFRLANHKRCVNELGAPDYCGPRSYEPETDRLLRNLGPDPDGRVTFGDVSGEAGLIAAPGPGLGVVIADFDRDGWHDVYVANDQARNHLWMNQGGLGEVGEGGHRRLFKEEALARGCALNSRGQAQASMGVDAGDFDQDGDEDLFMTHLLREVNTLYQNDGNALFTDQSTAVGLAVPSIGFTGFGTAFLDLDNDGWLDLVTVNGEVRVIEKLRAAGDPLPTRQPNQLFLNRRGRFVDASDQASVLSVPHTSRGAAVGDVDNDGDPDLLITNDAGPVQLLVNQVGTRSHWLGLRLVGSSQRDMLGAEVALVRPGQATLVRRVRSNASYLSAHDPRVLLGLGAGAAVGRVEVRWPSGRRESWEGLVADRYHTLEEGEGRATVGSSP